MTTDQEITVLITGFGEFLNIKTNPSWEIISLLPHRINDHSLVHPVRIITQTAPLKAVYHSLLSDVPPLLETHEPDFIIHMGLAADRDYFAIERGAGRDGYHQIPDEERKVVTRAETKRLWGKSPARLDSVMDIEDVLARWQAYARVSDGRGKDRGKGKRIVKEGDLKASDDVGNYVCGFIYYISLEWLWKKKRAAKVVFFHVPNLNSKDEFEMGRDITVALIKAVVGSCQH